MIAKVYQRLQEKYAEISICQILPAMLGFLIETANGSYLETARDSITNFFQEPVTYKNVPVFIDVSSGLACYPAAWKGPRAGAAQSHDGLQFQQFFRAGPGGV